MSEYQYRSSMTADSFDDSMSSELAAISNYWNSSNIQGMNFDEDELANSNQFSLTDDPSNFLDSLYTTTTRPATGGVPSLSAAPVELVSVIGDSGLELKKCSGRGCHDKLAPDSRIYYLGLCYCQRCYDSLDCNVNKVSSTVNCVDIIRTVVQGQHPLSTYLHDPYFKTIDGKRRLLLAACQCGAGDIIMLVVRFLHNSLSPTVFKSEITRTELMGIALLHHLAYLKQTGDLEAYKDTRLRYLPTSSSQDTISCLNFEKVLRTSDNAVRLNALERFLQSESAASEALLRLVKDYRQLLNLQIDVTRKLSSKSSNKSAVTSRYAQSVQQQQQTPVFSGLALMEFLYQAVLYQPLLDQSESNLTNRVLNESPVVSQDQRLWCKVCALCTGYRRAGGGTPANAYLSQLESVLWEKSGILSRTARPTLSWPVERQRCCLEKEGMPATILSKFST